VAPLADPLAVVDSDEVLNGDTGEGDDADDNEDVRAPRGSDATALSLLLV
jgi:hypothetical protein